LRAIDQPINPPIDAASTPLYGPIINPTNGAMISAAVKDLPTTPITGNKGMVDRTAYREAKTPVKASPSN